jgi:hypothetical protein
MQQPAARKASQHLFEMNRRTPGICSYHTAHAAGVLPAGLPPLPVVPVEPFQLTSFALVGRGVARAALSAPFVERGDRPATAAS